MVYCQICLLVSHTASSTHPLLKTFPHLRSSFHEGDEVGGGGAEEDWIAYFFYLRYRFGILFFFRRASDGAVPSGSVEDDGILSFVDTISNANSA